MMNKAMKTWIEAALADGWVKKVATGMYSGKKPRNSSVLGWPKQHYYLVKGDQEVRVWVGEKSSYSNLKFKISNGMPVEVQDVGQDLGYNYDLLVEKIKEIENQCRSCKKTGVELKQYGLDMRCGDCIAGIEKFAKDNPVQPVTYLGKAEVQFRKVYGRRATKKIKNFRVTASISTSGVSSYWEPYNGPLESLAHEIANAVVMTLKCSRLEVDYIESHTTWAGQVISSKKR